MLQTMDALSTKPTLAGFNVSQSETLKVYVVVK